MRNRRFAATVLAVALGTALLAPPAAQAAPASVTITADGYVPISVVVNAGEAVTFANASGAAREVEIKPTNGVTCTTTPLVVQPGASASCTFASAGNFAYSDPTAKGRGWRGTIAVAAPAAPTLSFAPARMLVVYKAQLPLSGRLVPAQAGATVEILARRYGQSSFAAVTSVVTGADGSYAATVRPAIHTVYQARTNVGGKAVTSPAATIDVRPRVALGLRELAGRTAALRTSVTSNRSYRGAAVLVQRWSDTGGWTTVQTVRLGSTSAATFTLRVGAGSTRVRTFLQAADAGAGYVASSSRVITITR